MSNHSEMGTHRLEPSGDVSSQCGLQHQWLADCLQRCVTLGGIPKCGYATTKGAITMEEVDRNTYLMKPVAETSSLRRYRG